MKINIYKDERYPDYWAGADEKGKIDIPLAQLEWIKEVSDNYDKVQTYLETVLEEYKRKPL